VELGTPGNRNLPRLGVTTPHFWKLHITQGMTHLLDGSIGVRPGGDGLPRKKQRPPQQDAEKTRDGLPQPHEALIVTLSSAALPQKSLLVG